MSILLSIRPGLPWTTARFSPNFEPSYKRGFAMQATLALIGFALGVAAWWQSGKPAFLVGALLILAPWPWTLLMLMPINNKLLATKPQDASAARTLLGKWNRLHAGRTTLGALSVVAFLIALA